MRQIKFRAWIGTQMEYQVVVGNSVTYFHNKIAECTTAYTKDTPVMQFTGLHDKNGKEIYEGDVTKDKMVIVFDELFSRFGLANYDLNARPNWVCSHQITPETEIEIIGNIYENPELLTQDKIK